MQQQPVPVLCCVGSHLPNPSDCSCESVRRAEWEEEGEQPGSEATLPGAEQTRSERCRVRPVVAVGTRVDFACGGGTPLEVFEQKNA